MVYRGEYLAYTILQAAERGTADLTMDALRTAASAGGEELLQIVRGIAEDRYDEGYERGVHDADAAKILQALVHLHSTCGLLRFPVGARAVALLAWSTFNPEKKSGPATSLRQPAAPAPGLWPKPRVGTQCQRYRRGRHQCLRNVGTGAQSFLIETAARYLVEELGSEKEPRFDLSGEAADIQKRFLEHIWRSRGYQVISIAICRPLPGTVAPCAA